MSALLSVNFAAQASWRCVLTGGPCVGKSTTLAELAKRGYHTIPEVFTTLFKQAEKNNALDAFFEDMTQLQTNLLIEQLRLESLLPATHTAFLDRSAEDIMAYNRYHNVPVLESLANQVRQYDIIFFLEPLPAHLFQNSDVRRETPEEALVLHNLVKDAYRQRGYKSYQLVDVPFGTPSERAQFILDTVSHVERTYLLVRA
jgi:predicted ATPase